MTSVALLAQLVVPDGLTIAPWAVTVVVIVGWVIHARTLITKDKQSRANLDKAKGDLAKLQADTIAVAGETLVQVQKTRDKHRDACSTVTKLCRQLGENIKTSSPQSNELREELCRVVSTEVLHHFHAHCEWVKLQYKHSPTDLENFVVQIVCPELDRIATWVAVCNHPHFVKVKALAPLKISSPTVRIYSQLLSELPDDHRTSVSPLVTRSIERVLSA